MSGKKVVVTGASGYVAAHIIRNFLSAGYEVVGTVRSNSSAESVKKANAEYANKLSFALVPDMTVEGAFDEASKGAAGIIHTASPFVLAPEDNERDLLQPAIQGTVRVLEAAQANGIKRVVITSSFAAILDLSQGYRVGHTYTEADWNPVTYDEAAKNDNGPFVYCASKKLAEKAAWDWVAEHKPNFDLATVNPPWVFGPGINKLPLSKLNESTEAIYKLVNGSYSEVPPVDFGGFVDVRDISLAHLRAFEVPEAGGHRFLVGNHFDYQSAVDALRPEFPQLKDKIPEGTPGVLADVYQVNGSKAEKILGIKYTPLAQTMKDTVAQLLEWEKA